MLQEEQKLRFLQFPRFLQKLDSIGTGHRGVSSKNCDFSKNCEKIGEIAVLLKLLSQVVQEKEACPVKTAISPKISKIR